MNCCLICSIIPALSNGNCCQKHLTLLTSTFGTTVLPPQVICMVPPVTNSCCKLKRHRRSCSNTKRHHSSSSSSSSSSSNSRHRKKKRSLNLKSFDTDDSSLSSNIQSTRITNSKSRKIPILRRPHRKQTSPLSSSINTNMKNINKNSRRQSRFFSTPSLTLNRHRTTTRRQSLLQNKSVQVNIKSTPSELIELDPELSYSPRLLLKRIIHVKDEDEEVIPINSKIILNMKQATEQMAIGDHPQPKIYLQRVCVER
ncbi:unnamed protein product [Adineta steineri]|uniref:Uncharacterized protein n=1 Tax=Adineta steineri TaxID=433720 RepID=A0A814IF64_9BILA|nr:unnamed protein product [Adineta steineri]